MNDIEEYEIEETEGGRQSAVNAIVMRTEELKARAVIAGDLYKEGKITRAECFRLEMDAFLGRNSGEIEYEDNNEHEWHCENNPDYRLECA